MKFCPPFCGELLGLPEPATMLGSDALVLGLTALVLAAIFGVALWRRYHPAR